MTPAELIALVQCPPLPDHHTPREQASPSALQQWAACPRSWGERYLHGRREKGLTWEEAEKLPEPPKPARGCSALEKATLEQAKKAWNKVRRPALGTEVHAILGAYMHQNTPGHWHPPMAWREIDWTTHAGKIARPACDVLPDPRGLVAVYTELAAEVECPDDWAHTAACASQYATYRCDCWPRMPGFYDLITVERTAGVLHYHPESDCYFVAPEFDVGDGLVCDVSGIVKHYVAAAAHGVGVVYRLWDFKTTSSFDWAKTAEELAEDPQVLLYSLHAMQSHGLDSIECNWVYLLTEGKPKAYVVTVTITRADAERAVIEMAHTASEVIGAVREFRAGRLRVVELDRDVSACTAYGGCVYHTDKGGPCDAKVSPGKALKQKAALEQKIQARKDARKEATMALSFQERKKQREAEKAAAAGGAPDPTAGTSEAPAADAGSAPAAASTDGGGAVVQTTIAPADAGASAKASAATTKLRANKPAAVKASASDAGIIASVEGFTFDVPASSALGKQLAKAAKGLQAAAAAFEGE